MLKNFKLFIRPFSEKLENLLKIGSYTNVSGSNSNLQEVQLRTLRNIEDAMKVGQFGFNSKAPNNSRCVVAKIGNENIIIANEHIASIIDIATGDSIVYNENGDYVKVEKDKITLKAIDVIIDSTNTTINATAKFTVNSPASEFNGGTITNDGTSIDKTHTHTQPNDSGGNSEQPTNAPS